MARKTKHDWLIAGTYLLTEVGYQGITIDALCKYLSVTKGSFYHHFAGYEDFKHSLLTFYEEEGTLGIIERLADLPTPEAKLHGLLDIIVDISTQTPIYPEAVIRSWAYQDEEVKAVQVRVDGRRLAYVQNLCQEITGDAAQSEIMAQLAYVILVGSEQMHPSLTGEPLRTLFNEFLRLYELE